MSQFLRLLGESDKGQALATTCARLRRGESDTRLFDVSPDSFDVVPGKPFAYWVSDAVRQTFVQMPPFESDGRSITKGAATSDNFRFIRLWWEQQHLSTTWVPCAKGGAYSPIYSDVFLLINWARNAAEMEAEVLRKYPYLNGDADWVLHRESSYFSPGLTWPLRSQRGFGMRAMPSGCVFGHKGPAMAVEDNDRESLLTYLAITTTKAFCLLVELQMAFGSYEVGVIRRTPVPMFSTEQGERLARLARRAWSLKRTLDTTNEGSHAFLLPAILRGRLDTFNPPAIEAELANIQDEIDSITFALYGFSDADREAAFAQTVASEGNNDEDDEEGGVEGSGSEAPALETLLSWAVGVAFGRFDWRLATGEREAPSEPNPFDPLPAKSPGMLPDGAEPFHVHSGILVDDQGQLHDLARLVEEVLGRVDCPVPDDVRRWLQRDFFPFHLQRYSKSRRKAPIYWPLSTASGSYTLWVYYPRLTSQTLYTAINDFIEPKLKQVSQDAAALRNKGSARNRDDEKTFEALQALEIELIDMHETLLKIAPTYRPNHDDGIQITAAPLWPLFRHKPWQKVLKETWEKLEKGEYHWAHLAMAYWPDRVREKCQTDKSLAIAHDLEHLYVEPEPTAKKSRGRRRAEADA